GPQPIDDASKDCLAQRIGDPKRNNDDCVICVAPMKIDFKKRRQNRKCLAIEVINDRGGKKKHSDEPSKGMTERSRHRVLRSTLFPKRLRQQVELSRQSLTWPARKVNE